MASKCWSAVRVPRSEPAARPGLVDQLPIGEQPVDETPYELLIWDSPNESTPCCRSGHSARHCKLARTHPGAADCAPRDDQLVVSGGIWVEADIGGPSASQHNPSTGRTKGLTPTSRTLYDLHVC